MKSAEKKAVDDDYNGLALQRQEAWIGDAVLALFVRQWLFYHRPGSLAAQEKLFKTMTANQFLSTFGNPTVVEAHIGRLYRKEGLAAAFAWLEAQIIPRFLSWEQKGLRGARKTVRS